MPIHGHLAAMIMWWTVEIAVFLLVWWLVYASLGGSRELSKDAKETLKGRLTSGQIDVEEYERRLNASLKDKKAA